MDLDCSCWPLWVCELLTGIRRTDCDCREWSDLCIQVGWKKYENLIEKQTKERPMTAHREKRAGIFAGLCTTPPVIGR